MHQGMLDIEVVLVMEDRRWLITTWARGLVVSIWRDGYGLEINLLTFCGCHVFGFAFVVAKENNKGSGEVGGGLYRWWRVGAGELERALRLN